jgi:hypothetical protein
MTNNDYINAVLEGRPIAKKDLLELRRMNVSHERRELFTARRILLGSKVLLPILDTSLVMLPIFGGFRLAS